MTVYPNSDDGLTRFETDPDHARAHHEAAMRDAEVAARRAREQHEADLLGEYWWRDRRIDGSYQ